MLMTKYVPLILMAIRGTIYQLLRLKFRGIILLDVGARIYGLGNIKLRGPIKLGRYALLDARFSDGLELGQKFSLGDFSIFRLSGGLLKASPVFIGDSVSFGPYCNIGGGFGLVIGAGCLFGPYVSIHPETHNHQDLSALIRDQGISGSGIFIDEDCWFSSKVTILDGSHIGKRSIVGAGAVLVGKKYSGFSTYVGVPARLIKFN